ncbi:MAG: hypothetical protein WBD85_21145 [Mycobacterium sp.]
MNNLRRLGQRQLWAFPQRAREVAIHTAPVSEIPTERARLLVIVGFVLPHAALR